MVLAGAVITRGKMTVESSTGAMGEGEGDGGCELDGVELRSAPKLWVGEFVGVFDAHAVLDKGTVSEEELAEKAVPGVPVPDTGGVANGVPLGVRDDVPLLD